MTHDDIDPSLRAAEPLLESLDDGFSPPADTHPREPRPAGADEHPQTTLSPKSPF
jgi:hypothetical protein